MHNLVYVYMYMCAHACVQCLITHTWLMCLCSSAQAGQVMCRRMVCDCDNPNADLFCCPECDPRLSSQCLHQNGLLTYGSGDTWVENCQQCQCLVGTHRLHKPRHLCKTLRPFSRSFYPTTFTANGKHMHLSLCHCAHTRNVTNTPVSMEMLVNESCAL